MNEEAQTVYGTLRKGPGKNGGYHRKKRSRESREDAVLMDRESNMTYSLISVTHLDWLL